VVTNKSGSVLQITMDPGLVFTANDSTLQNLVLAGAEMLAVQPFKEGRVDVQTFCAEARDRAPVGGMAYSRPVMGSTQLVAVAQYIKNNRLFDDLGQSAIWVVTNKHSLAGVYDAGRDAQSRKLVAFMASLLGQPEPDYFTKYEVNNTAGEPVFTGKPLKIYAQFETILEQPKKLSLGIYDATGKLIQGVFENRMFAGGKGHRNRVEFEAAAVPAGAYFIRLKEGETVLEEKKVIVE
jgi:hypothetical protein